MTPMGDAAWRFHLPAGASPAGVLASLRRVYGVVDAVVADGVALVCFDPALPPNEADLRACLSERECAREIPPREHVIRARYDGDDLGSVAVMCGVAPERVVEMHASRWYTVQVVGFLPGFGYLGPLCEMLAQVPRRPTPRVRVAPCSIGIAAGRTGVYPVASPGGWQLVGTAIGFRPFDVDHGAALSVGDRVRFEPVQRAMRGLIVEWIGPGATLQDRGRPGRMHMGIPPGGALVPGLFAATNAAAGAGRDAAAIELPLHGARLRAVGDLRVAIDGTSQGLIDGQMLDVRPSQFAVRYVSVEGGVDVPFALGGRGALLCVALGPAMLRAGDVLKAGEPVPATDAPWRWPDPDAPIRIIPGPDVLDEEALEVFLCAEFVVGTAMDRTGSRLDGLRIPGCANDLPRSAPMVRGAVQVTRDGVAIVLGPDHPTTGGYPVIAVVAREDQGALALRRPGSSVRFTVAGRHAAQRAG